jgi:kumamolisin
MPDTPPSSVKHPAGSQPLAGSEHALAAGAKIFGPLDPGEPVNITVIVRRSPGSPAPHDLEYYHKTPRSKRTHVSHTEFADRYGAAQADLDRVAEYARSHGLHVVSTHRARRSVELRGTASQANAAFGVALHWHQSPRGKYRSFDGPIHLPAALADVVEAVFGLDNRPVPARRGPVRRGPAPRGEKPTQANAQHASAQDQADPPNTSPLTPLQVAQLYDFPDGDGAGQTVGIYEMVVIDPNTGQLQNPGYTASDLQATFAAFGGGLTVPTPQDVAVDGQENAGVSDGETVLDITVAGAIAQKANIVVYFTGGTVASIIHALQRMIHPDPGDPVPTILSISYGWGPDDNNDGASKRELEQINQLFQDAANQRITVLVSGGDSGAQIESPTQAQASYPATDPWVLACGGTTIGNINGSSFTEYVWNDTFGGNSGATGGGISVRFNTIPSYQNGFPIPQRIHTGTVGRGIPDIAGNASPNSGYPELLDGQSVGPTGGTSAVAPLYAGLVARLNTILGSPAGFLNPLIYAQATTVCRNVQSQGGATSNSFDGVTGYPATPVWNACTGLGSIIGTKLLQALQSGS